MRCDASPRTQIGHATSAHDGKRRSAADSRNTCSAVEFGVLAQVTESG
jgi:hypothetical protein